MAKNNLGRKGIGFIHPDHTQSLGRQGIILTTVNHWEGRAEPIIGRAGHNPDDSQSLGRQGRTNHWEGREETQDQDPLKKAAEWGLHGREGFANPFVAQTM